jgi:DNA-binding NarL/FixJ family response regulator
MHERSILVGGRHPGRWSTARTYARTDEGVEPAGRRVLIVEDEALVALDIEVALQEAGYTVLGTVDTQDEAIAEARQLQPDIVVMDITLRQGDGIAASRAIGSQACIVFVSGNSDPRTLAAARHASPAGFLSKPFTADELVRAVGRAWERRGES